MILFLHHRNARVTACTAVLGGQALRQNARATVLARPSYGPNPDSFSLCTLACKVSAGCNFVRSGELILSVSKQLSWYIKTLYSELLVLLDLLLDSVT